MEVYIKDICLNDWQGLEWANEIAVHSKCLSCKVGACIVERTQKGVLVAKHVGYNAPPQGVNTCDEVGCRDEHDGKCANCLHAEWWATMKMVQYDVNKTFGHGGTFSHYPRTLYCTRIPCVNPCANIILWAQTIKRVVCYTHPKRDERAVARLLEAGVEFIEVMP